MRVAMETSTRDFGTGKLELSLVVFDYTEAQRQAIFAMCAEERGPGPVKRELKRGDWGGEWLPGDVVSHERRNLGRS